MERTREHGRKPRLYLDVDGVISVFGFLADGPPPGPLYEIDGQQHCIVEGVGERLARLSQRFELVWATGWEELANLHLPALLGESFEPLHTLTFDGRAVFGSAHWKIDAISEHAGQRPVAWIDDNLDDSCRLWALYREAPTLLLSTTAAEGLVDRHVDELLAWADALPAQLAA